MHARWTQVIRWLTLLGSGSVVFQVGGCDLILQGLQTGLLAAITGILYFLARNV